MGLGFVFWGIILAYVQTDGYTKKILLDETVSYQQSLVQQIIKQQGFEGKPVFLPPRYFTNPETYRLFISNKKDAAIPISEVSQDESALFITDSTGLVLTPPGAIFTRYFEKKLETNFAKVDLKYLQTNLPKIVIEDLEIAQGFEIRIDKKKVITKTTNSVFNKQTQTSYRYSHSIHENISPLSSAIACAIAKSTGQPVTIEASKTSGDGKYLETTYQIVEEAYFER